MKLLISVFTIFVAAPTFAHVSMQQCGKKAEQALTKEFANSYYDKDGFFAIDCSLANNNKAVLCSVGASKGDGAATDTYLVVLNTKCNYVFRTELIGEE